MDTIYNQISQLVRIDRNFGQVCVWTTTTTTTTIMKAATTITYTHTKTKMISIHNLVASRRQHTIIAGKNRSHRTRTHSTHLFRTDSNIQISEGNMTNTRRRGKLFLMSILFLPLSDGMQGSDHLLLLLLFQQFLFLCEIINTRFPHKERRRRRKRGGEVSSIKSTLY